MTHDMNKTLIAGTLASVTFTLIVVAVIAIILQSWAVLAYGLLAIVIAIIAVPVLIGLGTLFERLIGGSR